jgi:hypothetical protein
LTLTVDAPPGGDYADWAAEYPAHDLSDLTADCSGDGNSNFRAYAFGLDPISPAPKRVITEVGEADGGGFSFTYTRRAGSDLTCTAWIATDLQAQDWDGRRGRTTHAGLGREMQAR